MLQNSLERLLVGMARTLHQRVLPALDDRAVMAQVRAMIELLGNISTRVAWDVGHLAEIRGRLLTALAAVAGCDGAPLEVAAALARPSPSPAEPEALRADVVGLLETFAAAQGWRAGADPQVAGAAEAVAEVDAFAAWYLAEELSRLRSASFGRPTVPAAPSEGPPP